MTTIRTRAKHQLGLPSGARLAGVLALGGALLLAGCSGSGASDSSEANEAMPQADSAGGAEIGDAAAGADGVVYAEDEQARSVIQTGWVYLSADDPIEAGEQIIALVDEAGGRTDSRSFITETEHQSPSASLVVRIPQEELDATLASFADVADVEQSQISAEDVTATVRDLQARIDAKELSIQRLEDLLAEATTTADIISAEETLTQRQTELEQLLTEQKYLDDQVAMATVSVEIYLPDDVPAPALPGFLGGLQAGWNGLLSLLNFLVAAIGFLIPWLIPAALVAAVIVWVRRRRSGGAATGGPSAPIAAGPAPGAPSAPTQEREQVSAPAE